MTPKVIKNDVGAEGLPRLSDSSRSSESILTDGEDEIVEQPQETENSPVVTVSVSSAESGMPLVYSRIQNNSDIVVGRMRRLRLCRLLDYRIDYRYEI